MSVIAMSLAIQAKISDPLAKLLLMLLADRHKLALLSAVAQLTAAVIVVACAAGAAELLQI